MTSDYSAIIFTALVSFGFGCGTEGPVPMHDLDAQFFDSPFPSDHRTLSNGAPDYSGFPNPSGQALLTKYIDFTRVLSGAGTISPIFFRFDAAIDIDLLPTGEMSLNLDSTAMIIDVDPLSPNRGQRVPIQWEWQEVSTSHQSSNLLAIAPLFGTPLRANTKYAAIISTSLAQSDPMTAAAWHQGHENYWHMLDTKETLQEVGVPLEGVAIITQFTTQDPVVEMADLAWWAREIAPTPSISQTLEYTGQASEFFRFEGTVDVPLLQQGEKPYSSTGGGFVWEGVGLPDVHRGAAAAVLPQRTAPLRPVQRVRLAVDELDVVRALRVAVARAVLGAGVVAAVLREAAVATHLHKVQRAVQAAGQLAHVHVEGELAVLELEHLVVRVVLHEEHAAADVRAVVPAAARAAVCHEVQPQRRALARRPRRGAHAVGGLVVGHGARIQRAVLRAAHRVGADRHVPRVARVAVGVRALLVHPHPVRVYHHPARCGRARAGRRALLEAHPAGAASPSSRSAKSRAPARGPRAA